ncbi:MAG: hypothetical protein LBT74_06250 [Acidobacteriota bacterium]|jgi:hypothetical protein|nr:hypothetical protein [Acidobacteriota bacterium]
MVGAILGMMLLLQAVPTLAPGGEPPMSSDEAAQVDTAVPASAADAGGKGDAVAPPACYFKDGDGWTRMEPAPAVDARARGYGTYVQTYGYTDLGMDVAFAGAAAALRFSSGSPGQPVFLIRPQGGGVPEPMLVRLKKEGGRRVCRAKLSLVEVGNRYGFRKADIVRITVLPNPDGSIQVRPERRLKKGEYLLVVGTTAEGLDFGVD